MKRLMITTAAAAIALTGGAAYAECNTSMEAIDKEFSDFIVSEARINRDSRPVIQDLRDAAISLKTQGNEEGCEAVVSALGDVIDGFQTAAAERKEAQAEAKDVDRTTDEYFMTLRKEIDARVVEPIEGGVLMDTSELKGINIYNYRDEFLGEVDGLLMGAGTSPTHMIVGHGGFWNIGDTEVAIPLKKFMWDPEWEVFYVDMTEEQMDKAPDYDLQNGKWVKDQNDSYYDSLEG